MKKIYFLTFLIFHLSSAFAQQYTSSNPQFGWGGWQQHPCYKGIYIRVQKAYFNKGAKQWYWNWEIKNRYSSKIAISWVFYDQTEGTPEYTKARHTFTPNEIWSNGSFGDENKLSYFFDKACFSFYDYNGTTLDNCSEDPDVFKKDYYYSECDNGTPNIRKFNGGGSGSNTGNSSSGSGKESIEALMAKYNSLCTKLHESNDKALLDEHQRICTLGPDEEANTKTENALKTKIKQLEDVLAKYGSEDKEKSLDELIGEHKSLCQQLQQTDDNAHNEVYNIYCSQDEQLTGTFENQINTVKNKIQTLKNAIASADAKTNEKKTEAERLKKKLKQNPKNSTNTWLMAALPWVRMNLIMLSANSVPHEIMPPQRSRLMKRTGPLRKHKRPKQMLPAK